MKGVFLELNKPVGSEVRTQQHSMPIVTMQSERPPRATHSCVQASGLGNLRQQPLLRSVQSRQQPAALQCPQAEQAVPRSSSAAQLLLS